MPFPKRVSNELPEPAGSRNRGLAATAWFSFLLGAMMMGLSGIVVDSLLHAQDAEPDPLKYGVVRSDGLEILGVRWYVDPYSPVKYDPAVSLSVKNNCGERILVAIVNVVFSAAEGRHILRRDRLIHFLPEPFEPGETARWEIFPKPYGSSGMDDYPVDTRIDVAVEKLYCPKKNGPHVREFRWDLPPHRDFAW